MSWLGRLVGVHEPYWKLIKPYWERVSIYDGGDVFLNDFAMLPAAVRPLFAAHWFQSEVNNGGVEQFFMNSTGVLAPEAAEAFRALGMTGVADILDVQIAAFGPSYPRDQIVRGEWLEAIEEAFFASSPDGTDVDVSHGGPLLNPPNDQLWRLLKQENGGFVAAANRYAGTVGL